MHLTIISDTRKETRRFENNLENINVLIAWLRENKCQHVAMESSGIFWIPLYSALEDAGFKVVLANAHEVKRTAGRKTDVSDSEWLAQLVRRGLIKPSYVPERRIRELRELTRLRVKLVQTRASFKNRCHKVLGRVNIRLGSKLTDIFGKVGLEILEGLMSGKSIDAIIDQSGNRWLKRKRDEVTEVVRGTLSGVDMFILEQCVGAVKYLDQMIRKVDERVWGLVNEEDLKIVATIPGVGGVHGAAILAEIGDVKRFEDSKSLVSWAGLAPSVYQSAGKTLTGSITKKGSKWLRRTMIQVAHAAKRVRNSQLRRFYLRVKARKGKKIAIVALARKILTIIHHILINREPYVEEDFEKSPRLKTLKYVNGLSLENMAEILRSSGYLVSPLSD
jgi:transposase